MILPIHVSKCLGKKRIFSPVVIVKIIAKQQYCNWYLSKLHDLYYTWVTMTLITKYLRIIFGSFFKSMEAAGAKLLYQRSVQLRKLRYIPYIGDGDSKAYSDVCKDHPYGPTVFIPKEEGVSHVTKRMGSGLRKLLSEYKGKY